MRRLSVAKEDYLRTISKLGNGEQAVTVSALAAQMKITPPSVTGMIQRLAADGLVIHLPRAGVRLTRRGEALARSVHRRHRLWETFLVQVLGLDWSEVHEEAEALEHHLSDRVVEAIDRYLGRPRVDPHGHAIPNARGEVITRRLSPLDLLEAGDEAVIAEVLSDEPERIRWWKKRGLVPGAHIRVMERSRIDGIWRLKVGTREVITGTQGVGGLRVEKA